MSRPQVFQRLFTAGVMTGTNTLLSNVMSMWDKDQASIEGAFTGTPSGSFTLLGSDQFDPITNPNAVFVALAAGAVTPTFPAPAGAGGTFIVALTAQALTCRYIQLKYVNTAGVGVLDAFFHGKGIV